MNAARRSMIINYKHVNARTWADSFEIVIVMREEAHQLVVLFS